MFGGVPVLLEGVGVDVLRVVVGGNDAFLQADEAVVGVDDGDGHDQCQDQAHSARQQAELDGLIQRSFHVDPFLGAFTPQCRCV